MTEESLAGNAYATANVANVEEQQALPLTPPPLQVK